MRKQIWELTEPDIEKHPFWVFPMDEGEDETEIRPARDMELNDPNSHLLVRARFTEYNGDEWLGYVIWSRPADIASCQPLLWRNREAIGFWFGITRPSSDDSSKVSFPVVAKSEALPEFGAITLAIPGLCYADDSGAIRYIS
ncbi:hypothetical protein FH712_10055 [Marinobacter nauticus]|uniref:hypothetical protein n=1 Tax=Marinobacter nauticus TaxID=2743 RepID=UPI00112F8607|nr:hypothetical protein [Marinobacter nauticus]TPW23430.1 hypothetical protein FH712_10055 [Marinobacter nauticus]